MAQVSITDLVYRYPDAKSPALNHVSLEVERGEWVLLQGATGSGKSTLLKCISGACPAFYGGFISGEVLVSNTPVSDMTPRTRVQTMGFVGQDPEAGAVYDVVEREVAFSLENLGVSPADMRWRVAEALELVRLSHAAASSVAALSGGERQRLALAGALVHQPQLLLLDEPTSQLDPVSSDDLFDLLKRLQQEFGLTIVMSEHRLDAAYLNADRVVVLDEGRILHAGAPRYVAGKLRHESPAQVPTLARLFPDAPGPCLSVREAREVLEERFSNGQGAARVASPSSVQAADYSLAQESPQGLVQAARQGPLQSIRQAVSPATRPGAGPLVVELQSVTAFYPGEDEPALRDCTIAFPAGAVTAVVGPNGSGKSTLLRTLAGLQKVASGTIRWSAEASFGNASKGRGKSGWFGRRTSGGLLQESVDTRLETGREVAYLPQKPSDLFSQLTVEDELRYGLELRHLGNEEIDKRVQSAVRQFHLEPLLHRSPRDVSGGEQLRVSLACLWVTSPSVLLLDEPTRGLDASHKEQLGRSLLDLVGDATKGVVLVTHDMEFAAQFASNIVFLHRGSVAMEGLAQQVFGQALVFAPPVARAFRPYDPTVYRLVDAVRAGWAK